MRDDWERYLARLPISNQLRPAILQSWERCFQANVDRRRGVLHRVAGEDLARRLEREAQWLSHVRPQLEWLTAILVDVPHVAYVTDADGIVLLSTGTDAEMLREFGLLPGYDWSENRMGTNGAGTALASGEPITISGEEHWSLPFQGCVCTAAVIRDPRGGLLGAIDVSTAMVPGSPERQLLVNHAAKATEREVAAAESRRNAERLRLLYRAASGLLAADRPEAYLRRLVPELGATLGVDLYFNFLVEKFPGGERLRLDSYHGVEAEVAGGFGRLEFGVAVCGEVAQRRERIVREHVQASTEPLTALIRALEIDAYACFPLLAGDELLGTLSFGSRNHSRFGSDELELLKAVADQVAIAIARSRAHRLERELRATAERANEAKTHFLAVMSHELRTPLNAIVGYQDLMEAEIAGPVTNRQKEYLGRIQLAAEQLLELIEQILSLSKIESGKETIRLEPVDLAEIARETAALMEPAAAKKDLTLRLSLPDSLILPASRGKVRQILLNLLGNAIRYTDRGWVAIELAVDDELAVCHIRDTGRGVPDADLERIFEPFERGDASFPRSPSGTGLGLAVSRNLAELLGGELTVRSELGQGSVFTLRLPVAGPGVTGA